MVHASTGPKIFEVKRYELKIDSLTHFLSQRNRCKSWKIIRTNLSSAQQLHVNSSYEIPSLVICKPTLLEWLSI